MQHHAKHWHFKGALLFIECAIKGPCSCRNTIKRIGAILTINFKLKEEIGSTEASRWLWKLWRWLRWGSHRNCPSYLIENYLNSKSLTKEKTNSKQIIITNKESASSLTHRQEHKFSSQRSQIHTLIISEGVKLERANRSTNQLKYLKTTIRVWIVTVTQVALL